MKAQRAFSPFRFLLPQLSSAWRSSCVEWTGDGGGSKWKIAVLSGYYFYPRSPPRACCPMGAQTHQPSSGVREAPPRRQPLSEGHSSRTHGCGQGRREGSIWKTGSRRLAVPTRQAPFRDWPSLRGELKGKLKALPGGIRHPLGHQQGLWTMVGSESMQPLSFSCKGLIQGC